MLLFFVRVKPDLFHCDDVFIRVGAKNSETPADHATFMGTRKIDMPFGAMPEKRALSLADLLNGVVVSIENWNE